jgi:ATP-binding cassette subfamily B protein
VTSAVDARPDPVPDRAARALGRRLVLRALRPGGPGAVALVACVLAATALPVLAPRFTSRFVDDAIAGAGTGRLVLVAGGYLVVAVAALATRTVLGWLANRLAWDGTNRLREQAAEHALGLDLGFHTARSPGELVERVDGDVAAVAGFAVAFLLDVVASLLLLVGVIVGVFVVDVRLGLVLAVYCLLVGAGMLTGQRLGVPSAARSRAAGATMTGKLEEALAGLEDLRANGAGEYVVSRFHRTAGDWYRAELRGALVGVSVLAATGVAFAAGTALILALAVGLLARGSLTVGTAVLLFQYTLLVRAPFERLVEQLRHVQGALAAAARLGDLLGMRPGLPAPASGRPLPAGPLAVSLDRVGHRYPDTTEPSLADVRIELAPGEVLGLAGRTGSGKTTLARLLLRLYDPETGAVRVGGHDLRDVDPRSLRRRVRMVTQDVQLFSASIRDNLTLFGPGGGPAPGPGPGGGSADDAALRAVLHEVGLGPWLAGRSLDEPLTGLSAGEAQLLAYARVLLSDPGLIVLDEPSSRLDPATERRIEASIGRLLQGRTGVLVAHRLSSLDRADSIAVLHEGRVVEYGPRAELVADPGSRFARMLTLAGAPR